MPKGRTFFIDDRDHYYSLFLQYVQQFEGQDNDTIDTLFEISNKRVIAKDNKQFMLGMNGDNSILFDTLRKKLQSPKLKSAFKDRVPIGIFDLNLKLGPAFEHALEAANMVELSKYGDMEKIPKGYFGTIILGLDLLKNDGIEKLIICFVTTNPIEESRLVKKYFESAVKHFKGKKVIIEEGSEINPNQKESIKLLYKKLKYLLKQIEPPTPLLKYYDEIATIENTYIHDNQRIPLNATEEADLKDHHNLFKDLLLLKPNEFSALFGTDKDRNIVNETIKKFGTEHLPCLSLFGTFFCAWSAFRHFSPDEVIDQRINDKFISAIHQYTEFNGNLTDDIRAMFSKSLLGTQNRYTFRETLAALWDLFGNLFFDANHELSISKVSLNSRFFSINTSIHDMNLFLEKLESNLTNRIDRNQPSRTTQSIIKLKRQFEKIDFREEDENGEKVILSGGKIILGPCDFYIKVRQTVGITLCFNMPSNHE